MIRLVVKKGKVTFGEFEFTKDRIHIGRQPENDVVLSVQTLSRRHAMIERRRESYLLNNISRMGEMFVNGKLVPQGEFAELASDDEIALDTFTIKVSISSESQEGTTISRTGIQRPKRWAVPFGEKMSYEEVDYILSLAPFTDIDQTKFPNSASLRDILRNDARLVRYRKGDIIIREGDYGNSAFFILKGKVRVVLGKGDKGLPSRVLGRRRGRSKGFIGAIAQLWTNNSEIEVRNPKLYKNAVNQRKSRSGTRIVLQDVPAVLDKYNTAEIGAGNIFGEIAALSRTPRTASVIAEEDCECVEIRWQGLRDIRKRAKELKEYIDEMYRKNALRVQIQETPLFKYLTDEQLDTVVQNTIFETHGDFEWFAAFKKSVKGTSAADRLKKEPIIAEEGNYPDGVIMIRSGFARLSQKIGYGHRTLAYLGKGHMYGLEEIAHNSKAKNPVFLQRTLRAIGYTDILVIPTKIMEEIVLPSLPKSELPAPIETSKKEEEEIGATEQLGSSMMEFLVENRFINGTATMMINLDRCARCDDCVRACANGHNNNPRFIRHGLRIDKFMVANACMHCNDPVCMLGCPTGAIHRDPFQGQVVVNDVTCIGCATCANSCPYNNIRMTEIRDKKGEFIIDEETNGPIFKATKCDLCIDQMGGPACERACPHDALKRIDMSNLEVLAKWINR